MGSPSAVPVPCVETARGNEAGADSRHASAIAARCASPFGAVSDPLRPFATGSRVTKQKHPARFPATVSVRARVESFTSTVDGEHPGRADRRGVRRAEHEVRAAAHRVTRRRRRRRRPRELSSANPPRCNAPERATWTAVSAALHAVSTETAVEPKPNANAIRPAATLSADPVAAYGDASPPVRSPPPPPPPPPLPRCAYSMCWIPTATATPPGFPTTETKSPSPAPRSAASVDSRRRRCCGSTCFASPRCAPNASGSKRSTRRRRKAPKRIGRGEDDDVAPPPPPPPPFSPISASHRAHGTTSASDDSFRRPSPLALVDPPRTVSHACPTIVVVGVRRRRDGSTASAEEVERTGLPGFDGFDGDAFIARVTTSPPMNDASAATDG
eukprot:30816-Pelagococcus_subviridis.AAC.3